MTPDRLNELLEGFGAARVLVVGDFFLDKYLEVEPSLAEPSLETGLTAHQVVDVRCAAGAAGTVVNNMMSLEPQEVRAFGAIGDDGEGLELRRALQSVGCDTQYLLSSELIRTPTYLKPRDVGSRGLEGEHSRYDTINRIPLPDDLETQLLNLLAEAITDADAVVILDQVESPDCGVITRKVRESLCELAATEAGKMFWADSRVRSQLFRNVTVKVNQFEACQSFGSKTEASVQDVFEVVAAFRDTVSAPVFVTCGPAGIVVSDPMAELVKGLAVNGPIDPTGAGDSVTASAVLALVAGAEFAEAALIGNLVASVTVQQLATTGTARREDVVEQLVAWRSTGR